jgi:hypothetical protein
MNKMLWTQDGPVAWCKLDDVLYKIVPYVSGSGGVWFQLLIYSDTGYGEMHLSDNTQTGRSAQELAVFVEGMLSVDPPKISAGKEAVRRWKWLGQLWSAPETQPIETLD